MRSIRNCLNRQLRDLCQKSLELEELSNQVEALLPTALAKICKVGSFTKGCLTLTTNDAVWATQLRYFLPELRDKLRKDAGMYQLSSIKVTVITPEIRHKKTKNVSKTILSEKTKANIISESQQCSYHPLKKALLRLAEGIPKS